MGGRAYQSQRFSCRKDRPHAGQPQPGFVTRNGHGVKPTLVEMVTGHPNELIEYRPKARQVPRVEQIPRF